MPGDIEEKKDEKKGKAKKGEEPEEQQREWRRPVQETEGDAAAVADREPSDRRRPSTHAIGPPGSSVGGSDSAEVGGVTGEMSFDDAVRFSGERP